MTEVSFGGQNASFDESSHKLIIGEGEDALRVTVEGGLCDSPIEQGWFQKWVSPLEALKVEVNGETKFLMLKARSVKKRTGFDVNHQSAAKARGCYTEYFASIAKKCTSTFDTRKSTGGSESQVQARFQNLQEYKDQLGRDIDKYKNAGYSPKQAKVMAKAENLRGLNELQANMFLNDSEYKELGRVGREQQNALKEIASFTGASKVDIDVLATLGCFAEIQEIVNKGVFLPINTGSDLSTVNSGTLREVNYQAMTRKDGQLKKVEGKDRLCPRESFLNDDSWKTKAASWCCATFVPQALAQKFLGAKTDFASHMKYHELREAEGETSKISNAEGAMHTFSTGVCKASMTHDFLFTGRNTGLIPLNKQDGTQRVRDVVVSTQIQPDFEMDGEGAVMFNVCRLKDEEQKGEPLSENFQVPDSFQEMSDSQVNEYDRQLNNHMIHHLTGAHKLPSKSSATVLTVDQAITELEAAIKKKGKVDPSMFVNKAVKIEEHYQLKEGGEIHHRENIISLEALFNIYANSLSAEFAILEGSLSQGYIYTIDPPNIFVNALGGGDKGKMILNRMQALAFKNMMAKNQMKNLKAIAFNNYADEGMVDLYKQVLPKKSKVKVMSKQSLYSEIKDKDGKPTGRHTYSPGPGLARYALVIHNNSDAFGQNIEYEGDVTRNEKGCGSLDAAIGSYSDASKSLQREREEEMTIWSVFGRVLRGGKKRVS